MVSANRELVDRMKQHIQDAIGRVWGKEATALAEG